MKHDNHEQSQFANLISLKPLPRYDGILSEAIWLCQISRLNMASGNKLVCIYTIDMVWNYSAWPSRNKLLMRIKTIYCRVLANPFEWDIIDTRIRNMRKGKKIL